MFDPTMRQIPGLDLLYDSEDPHRFLCGVAKYIPTSEKLDVEKTEMVNFQRT